MKGLENRNVLQHEFIAYGDSADVVCPVSLNCCLDGVTLAIVSVIVVGGDGIIA